jgi:NAD+ synthase (glutamine-hydrolysing)
MKIAVAQINTTVGDFTGNETAIRGSYARAVQAGADLVIFPELATCGYPPRDLLCKAHFVEANLAMLERLARDSGETAMVIGYVDRNEAKQGRELRNSVAVLGAGKILARRHKTLLPSYDVFDEDRYFEPADLNEVVELKGTKLGLTVCEDVWNDEGILRDGRRYSRNPAETLVAGGAEIILNASASPWQLGKASVRLEILGSLARRTGRPVIYCNLVGGNDELIFDGGSLVFDSDGALVAQGTAFAEDFLMVDLNATAPIEVSKISDEAAVYDALVLGVRDYFRKCGFRQAVLGLSGGIDSALTAVIAADALGKENVRGVAMPSQYSSVGSLTDAEALARNLGIQYDVIPIKTQFDAVTRELADVFAGRDADVTEENIQARLRGVTMMAISNKFGSLLLTTGNKSELAVGYCTLYGDMCGGLAVISDVPKTMVYRISEWVNRDSEIIPTSTLTKPPSAELRPDQKDQDSLPDYDTLDSILELYVVEHRSLAEIVARGFDSEVVKKLIRLIDLNEYKRRQAAPGLKVTSRAFGVGRRMPVAQRWREY